MRVDELTGIKHLRDKPLNWIFHWLKREFCNGRTSLRLLGRGSNGVALTDGTTVFKLWVLDSAYEQFIEFCLKNPDNPFLPKLKSKIRSLPRALDIDAWNEHGDSVDFSKIRYVKMEKLEPYRGDGGFYLFPPDICRLVDEDDDLVCFVSFDTLLEYGDYFTGDFHRDVSILFDDVMRGYAGYPKTVPYEKYASKINRELMALIKTITQLSDALTGDYRFDPGNRNLALRGKQVVILDPIVNDDDLDLNARFLELVDNCPNPNAAPSVSEDRFR